MGKKILANEDTHRELISQHILATHSKISENKLPNKKLAKDLNAHSSKVTEKAPKSTWKDAQHH